ncbi:hypothetical protein [Ramlibacter sp.]|uniref:hypothetical protein n=1 Tax=Ramlibacter sp. TaxID=1917967 RepID=UPI0026267A12|nr:hypothetical protein [Ramlibacter sp.]MDB5957513.1 hypothetical protein [Ramlibacter sp.]
MSDAELLLLVESKKKSGWVAAFLNLVVPGAGYMYCGNWILGLVAFLFAVVVLVVTLGAGAAVVYPVVFIDGFLAAGRANKNMIQKLIADRAAIARGEAPAI